METHMIAASIALAISLVAIAVSGVFLCKQAASTDSHSKIWPRVEYSENWWSRLREESQRGRLRVTLQLKPEPVPLDFSAEQLVALRASWGSFIIDSYTRVEESSNTVKEDEKAAGQSFTAHRIERHLQSRDNLWESSLNSEDNNDESSKQRKPSNPYTRDYLAASRIDVWRARIGPWVSVEVLANDLTTATERSQGGRHLRQAAIAETLALQSLLDAPRETLKEPSSKARDELPLQPASHLSTQDLPTAGEFNAVTKCLELIIGQQYEDLESDQASLMAYKEVARLVRKAIVELPGLQQLSSDQSRRNYQLDRMIYTARSWLLGAAWSHLYPTRVHPKPGEVELSWMYGYKRRFTTLKKNWLTGLHEDIPLAVFPGPELPLYGNGRTAPKHTGSGPSSPVMAMLHSMWRMVAGTSRGASQRPEQNTRIEPDEPPPHPEPEDTEGDFFLAADMFDNKERRATFAAVSLEEAKDDRDFYLLARKKLQAARFLSKEKQGTFELPSDISLAKFFFLPSKTDVVTVIPYAECTDNPFTPPRPYYHGTRSVSAATTEAQSEATADIWELILGIDPDADKAMRIFFQILGEYIRDGVRRPDSGAGLKTVLNMLPRRPTPPALERKPWVKEWCFHASYASAGRDQGPSWVGVVAVGGMIAGVIFACVWLWKVDGKDLQNASTVFVCFAAGFAMLQMTWAQPPQRR